MINKIFEEVNVAEQTSILGTKISLTNPGKVLDLIRNYDYSSCSYICLFGMLELLQSYTDPVFQKALNNSFFNPLHSRSIEFILKRRGIKNIEPVDAVWLFRSLLGENLSHYFYGPNDFTLDKIIRRVEKEYPNAKITGYKTAPFLQNEEIKDSKILKDDLQNINARKPDIIWVGIGGLKQDLLMYYYSGTLEHSLMIGVGAVFDIFAGNLKQSPLWMKRLGIRWLYFLVQQPSYRILKLKKLFTALIKTIVQKKVKSKRGR